MSSQVFEPITPSLGAWVHLSPPQALEDGVPSKISEALSKYGVLVFPEANFTDEELVALTSQIGDYEAIRGAANDASAASAKGIYRVSLDKPDKTQREYIQGNDFWHMDGTAYKVPGKGTLLKCEVPPDAGGDTGFANLFAAYDALPEEKKQALSELRVVHCLEASMRRIYPNPSEDDLARWNSTFPPTEHPLVWKHKDGRTSLVIGATAMDIVGMPHEEGKKLLEELNDWCSQERFTYRHKWKKGDLVIFNNPGLLHRSYPYTADSGRMMHRTTLKGHEEIA